jgi:hypothetical protein
MVSGYMGFFSGAGGGVIGFDVFALEISECV